MVQICSDSHSKIYSFIFRAKNLKVDFIRSIHKDFIAINKGTASFKRLYYSITLEEFTSWYKQ